tara:strand:+ start:705 stop:2390 length:1686 start_codon:yes stop_codon:yes gene_type:complete
MRVLFVNPRYPERPRGIFPMGLAYVAGSLCAEGHDVKILDTDGECVSEKELRKTIREGKFDIIGTGGLITAYNHIKWIISLVKEIRPDIPVMVGGGGASSVPLMFLEKTKADIVVVGEGENTVLEILKILNNGGNLSEVKGICFKEQGAIYQNCTAGPIENIDNLPFPKWDLFQIETYIQANLKPNGIRSMPIFASRSCPYPCNFCFHPIGKKYRSRSNQNILDEIKYLIATYNIQHIQFVDELFIFDKKQIIGFCELLLREKVNIPWTCASRTNIADIEMYKIMKKAGCTNFQYGIESGSTEMLKSMKKNETVEGAKKAINIARAAGFEPLTTFMIGTIGENDRTISETVEFIKEMNLHIGAFFFTTPYPGTEIYDWSIKEGLVRNEEKFIMSLSNAVKYTINLTKLSDWKLIKLKCNAEKEVISYYNKNNVPKIISIDNKTKHNIKLKIQCLLPKCGNIFSVEICTQQLTKCPYCGKNIFLNRTLLLKHLGIKWYLDSLLDNFIDIKSIKTLGLRGLFMRLYTKTLEKFAYNAVCVYLSSRPIIRFVLSIVRTKKYWEN